jgi:hypothetical protein
MARAHIIAIAAVALFAGGSVLHAAADTAPAKVPFGCDAPKGTTCFFKLFLGPRNTRIVQLKPGMKVSIPGVVAGRDKYCASLNTPPVPSCARQAIDATYNH